LLAVIMAGGSGRRFWPRSRRERPKQLIDLTGRGSMIQLTAERLSAFCSPEELFIVTVAPLADAIALEVAGKVPRAHIVEEPQGRNTAAAAVLAASIIESRFGDVPFLMVPADHVITDEAAFRADALAAERYLEKNDRLLTFGIRPSRPETGYGYIKKGAPIAAGDAGAEIFEVESFHEKPSAQKAKAYCAGGDYFWNSGLFAWRPSVILRAVEKQLPDLVSLMRPIRAHQGTEPLLFLLKPVYERVPAISIDHAVMEKADNVAVLRARFGWSDVGSWESLREIHSPDANGNVLIGEHVLLDAKDNTVFSPDRLVAVIGLSDVVIVDGGDAILVCRRDRVQQVRDAVEALERSGKTRLY